MLKYQDFHNLVVIAGPSASGKDTVAKLLIKLGYNKVISTTTRSARAGEINHEDYHFISRSAFLEMSENNDFIESINFSENYYGLAKKDLENLSNFNVLILTPAGITALEEYLKSAKLDHILLTKVFIDVELDDQVNRLVARNPKVTAILERLESDQKSIREPILKYDLVLNSSIQSETEITNLINSAAINREVKEGMKQILARTWSIQAFDKNKE